MKTSLNRRIVLLISIVLTATLVMSIAYHYLGMVMIKFRINPSPAEMTPSVTVIRLGDIYSGEVVSAEMVDTESDLVVNETTDIAINLTGDIEYFKVIMITVYLMDENSYYGYISDTTPYTIIKNVTPGRYNIYVDYYLVPKNVDEPINGSLYLEFYWLSD
ncbi:MAG: hypothetical protein B6U89_03980 [Desulfurococcales archaeon ex4484_58]|nr:MAG: hypothetical protein B6U89_03980 [Desulfurococcales archaeon ex4484_58]